MVVGGVVDRASHAWLPVSVGTWPDTVYMQRQPTASERDAVRRIIDRLRARRAALRRLNGRVTPLRSRLYGLFALFALAVLAVAVVGFVATGNDHVAEDIVSWLGLHGDAATDR